MTAYVIATLRKLLLRGRSSPLLPLVERAPHSSDAVETLPVLFRSEGFVEDLFDSYTCR